MKDTKKHTPYNEPENEYPFEDEFSVASDTEMTGLMPTPPENGYEGESYSQIYETPLPRSKKASDKNGKKH